MAHRMWDLGDEIGSDCRFGVSGLRFRINDWVDAAHVEGRCSPSKGVW